MNRLLCTILTALLATGAIMAQNQSGYVKTKGRLNAQGAVIAGKRLPGATIQVRGRNAVVSNANGDFSLAIPSRKYYLQKVSKNGYALIDPDALFKIYSYSTNPLVIVMGQPEQQREDKLAAEKKLRRSLQRQLEAKEEALEELRHQNKMTQDAYNKALEALYQEQDKNGGLIGKMAEHYALVDYDQLDDFNREVCACILNGELVKADSLLRSKGDLDQRLARVREQEEAQAAERVELSRRQHNLELSIAGTQAEKEDIALDCFNFYQKFIIECQHDSASHYIEKRAAIDPHNSRWQLDAGSYFQKRGLLHKAKYYNDLALQAARQQVQADPQAHLATLAMTLDNIALMYQEQDRTAEAEDLLTDALEIYRRLDSENPDAFDLKVASVLNKLALLHSSIGQSEPLYASALEICQRHMQDDVAGYAPFAAQIFNNLGALYDANQYAESGEQMYNNALDIYRRLAANDPDAYSADVASTLNNLSTLYHRYGFNVAQVEPLQQEALQIYRRLAADNPLLYKPKLAALLSNRASQCYSNGCGNEGELAYDELLDTYRALAQDDPFAYRPRLASALYEQGIRLYQEGNTGKSEKLFTEALGIYRELASIAPSTYKPDLARLLRNVATLLDKRQSWDESERLYLEELTINKELAQGNPGRYMTDVARSYGNLSNHALLMKQFDMALDYGHQGLACDSTRLFIQANLAAAHLFKGEYDLAEVIYRQYRQRLRDTFLDDLEQFGRMGIIPKDREPDVERIRRLLLGQ